MTTSTIHPTFPSQDQDRRPAFPIESQGTTLFLGWGPKL